MFDNVCNDKNIYKLDFGLKTPFGFKVLHNYNVNIDPKNIIEKLLDNNFICDKCNNNKYNIYNGFIWTPIYRDKIILNDGEIEYGQEYIVDDHKYVCIILQCVECKKLLHLDARYLDD